MYWIIQLRAPCLITQKHTYRLPSVTFYNKYSYIISGMWKSQTWSHFILDKSERGTCIMGLFWPPLEPRTENCFSPISFDWFIRRLTVSKNLRHFFKFYLAMVTKMVDKMGLKQRNCHFGTNLRLLETDFEELDISTAKYQKILLICCVPW